MTGARSAEDQVFALLQQGRAADALAVIEPHATAPDAGIWTLMAHAAVLQNLGRIAEAVEVYRLSTQRFPADPMTWHNLGTALSELKRDQEALVAIETAFRLGLDGPQTWLAWGRANQGLDDLEKAERGYREAIRRQPDYVDAVRDLAHLVWMRSEDAEAAAAEFDKTGAWSPAFAFYKSRIFKFAGLEEKALATAEGALRNQRSNVPLLMAATQYAQDLGKYDRALLFAQEAVKLSPGDISAVESWAGANLAANRLDEALRAARYVVKVAPERQMGLAMLSSVARAAGAEEYEQLYDYDAFVRGAQISAPKGWATLEAYLADLKAALDRLHVYKAHPLEQSLRFGTQTVQDLRTSEEPAVAAFFEAIRPVIQDYMDALGEGDDALRRRNTRGYDVTGAWSVRLRPCGFHVDHIHQDGWLSSAFYVETPKAALEHPDREGWIKFGAPGLSLPEKPLPGHFEKPVPGKLVLFPSYMWHGTVPFTTDESRMTMAFDVVPAAPQEDR